MDKNTLSQYGWVIIVIIVLAIMIGLATPFGNFVKESVMSATGSFGQKIVNSLESAGVDVKNSNDSNNPNGSDENEPDEVVHNYTLQEIEDNDLLYAIGATQLEYVVAEFNEDYTEVTIYKNGENSDGLMLPFYSNPSPMIEKKSSLTKAYIENGVSNINEYAFDGCLNLSSVTIPDSVTSIGVNAFSNCTSLMSITVPDSVTSIGYYAFYNCKNLSSIVLGNGITNIANLTFYCCFNLTSVVIPDGVTSIDNYAFRDCASLTTITIPDSVTNIGDEAFQFCSNLTTITIPESVTHIGVDAFAESGLTTIKGAADSYAETYANNNGYTFVAI